MADDPNEPTKKENEKTKKSEDTLSNESEDFSTSVERLRSENFERVPERQVPVSSTEVPQSTPLVTSPGQTQPQQIPPTIQSILSSLPVPSIQPTAPPVQPSPAAQPTPGIRPAAVQPMQIPRAPVMQPQPPIQSQPLSNRANSIIESARNSWQQSQIPMIILMRRSQRASSFHPFLFPLERRSGLGYQPEKVGRDSTYITCPVCKQRIMTMVVNEPKCPRCLITFLLITIPCCCCMSNKPNQPPPYSENQPGFTPASYYQPGQPQQPLYPPMPQPPPQQSTVIIQTTTRPTLIPLGNQPSRITCPSCHAEILTTVKHQPSSRTHCWAIILCLFICWPCVCLPYCMDSCQNANHYCPNCNAYVGTYEN